MAFYLGKDKQKITISEAMLGGGTTRPVETKEVAYNKNGTYEIKPTSGYVMSKIDVTVEVPPKEEQSKSKDITENGIYTITPDKNKVLSEAKVNVDVQPVVEPLFVNTNNTYTPPSGVDGFSSVEVNVPSRYNDGVEDGKEIGRSEGYAEGYEVGYQYGLEVNNFNVATLRVTENNTTYLPEDYGLDGFGSVEVKVPINLYAETITENNKTYMPKEDFDGFSEIIVKVPERYDEGLEDGKVIGREEGYQNGRDSIKLYNETITESGSYTVEPKEGFDGFSSVTVDVPERYDEGFEDGKASVKIQLEKEAKENGTIEPDDGFDGLAKVIVAVPQKTEVDLEETITENHKTFTYEPEDGETFKKVIINVNAPTEIEGEFNGVALLEEGNLVGENVYYRIYDNGWAIIDGEGAIGDCEGYNDDPFGLGQNMNPPSPFWNYSSITHVYIADGITHIGAGLFADCSNIEELRLPDSLTHIGTCAFENTSITKIYIPESVTTIEENAFIGCNDLTDVYYAGTKSEWDAIFSQWDALMGGLANTTLHCEYEEPTGSDTPELTTEIWEFEMEDGSIITKEVVVV